MKTTEGSLAHRFLLLYALLTSKLFIKTLMLILRPMAVLEIRFIMVKKHRDLVTRTLSNLFLIIVGQVVDLAQIHL